MNARVSKSIKLFFSITLLLVFLFIAFRNIQFPMLWQYISSANHVIVLVCAALWLLPTLLKSLRWRIILKPHSPGTSLFSLYKTVFLISALNYIIPRGGDIAGPAFFSRKERIPLSVVYGTMVVDRIAEILALFLLLLCVLAGYKATLAETFRQFSFPYAFYGAILVILFFTTALLLLTLNNRWYKTVARLASHFSEKLSASITRIAESFQTGLTVVKSPKTYFPLLAYSLVLWAFMSLIMYVLFHAFPFHARLHLTYFDALLIGLFAAVNNYIFQTPAGIGVTHTSVKLMLVSLWGVGGEEALAFATVFHAVGYCVNISAGGLALFMERKQFFLRRSGSGTSR